MGEMRAIGRVWAVLVFLVAGVACHGQAALPEAMQQEIDRAAAEVLASTGVPSASVAVVQGGRVAYVKAYGKAKLEPPVEATPVMQYSVGSVSKQFTAALLLLLQQDGKLSLNDPVGKWLPELTRSREVTLREVLSMTSGYQDFWPEDYVMTSMMAPTTPERILEVWGRKPLDFEPGTQWQYSNTNYVIAGRIAEIAGGRPVFEQVEERILKPLGMTGVWNSDASRLPQSDPTGYYRHALGPLRPAPQEGTGWMFAAGELAMPASDLAKWNVSLIDRSLLQPASYDEMFREVRLKDGKGTHYGLGVEVRTHDGREEIEHSGEVSGFVSENVVYPKDKAAVTVLTNEDASVAAEELARRISETILPGGEKSKSGDTARKEDRALRGAGVATAEARARDVLTGLQKGKLDRMRLTDFCNSYFSKEAVGDFESSLGPLGAPVQVRETEESSRGGMRFRSFDVTFAKGKAVQVTEYEMPDGRLEQFLVTAGGS